MENVFCRDARRGAAKDGVYGAWAVVLWQCGPIDAPMIWNCDDARGSAPANPAAGRVHD